jgi:ABC-type multidrug transport system fused ATPase/permease subunit
MLGKISYIYMLGVCWRLASRVERLRLLAVIGFCILAMSMSVSRPVVIGKLIQTLAADSPEFHRQLFLWLGVLVLNTVLFWVFLGPSRLIEQNLARDLKQRFIEDIYRKVTSLSWGWHQSHHSGDTLSRINKASTELYNFTNNQFWYVQIFSRLLGSTVMLLLVAPQVGCVIAITAPMLYVVIRYFDKKLMALTTRQNKLDASLSGMLADFIGNIGSLLALRLASSTLVTLSQRFAPIRENADRGTRLGVAKWSSFSISLEVAGIAALLFYILQQGDVRTAIIAGTVVTVFQYLELISGGLQGLAEGNQYLLEYRAALMGVDEIEAAAKNVTPSVIIPVHAAWANIKATELTFRYEDQEHRTHHLDGVSIELARGRRIALVGSSGSGKSTLLRLLRGLHEPASGILTIDGQPAGFPDLATMSTLILQDAEIFENTIRYNLTCGIDADSTELDRAIHAACLQPVIEGLPQGLDTDIRERGVNLSGGQKQRLALARGLYAGRDSSLLLLDEPTSSLDPVTESQIFDRLLADRADACIIASLHRLHLLDRFDHVCVMDNGRIVEEGTLSALLATQGKLFELWQAQKREEKENAELP